MFALIYPPYPSHARDTSRLPGEANTARTKET